jgi:hypothetical protein
MKNTYSYTYFFIILLFSLPLFGMQGQESASKVPTLLDLCIGCVSNYLQKTDSTNLEDNKAFLASIPDHIQDRIKQHMILHRRWVDVTPQETVCCSEDLLKRYVKFLPDADRFVIQTGRVATLYGKIQEEWQRFDFPESNDKRIKPDYLFPCYFRMPVKEKRTITCKSFYEMVTPELDMEERFPLASKNFKMHLKRDMRLVVSEGYSDIKKPPYIQLDTHFSNSFGISEATSITFCDISLAHSALEGDTLIILDNRGDLNSFIKDGLYTWHKKGVINFQSLPRSLNFKIRFCNDELLLTDKANKDTAFSGSKVDGKYFFWPRKLTDAEKKLFNPPQLENGQFVNTNGNIKVFMQGTKYSTLEEKKSLRLEMSMYPIVQIDKMNMCTRLFFEE